MTEAVGSCIDYVVVRPGGDLQNLAHDVAHAHVRAVSTGEEECYYRFGYNSDRSTGGWVSSRATVGAGVELSPEVVIGPWVRIENSELEGRISMHGTEQLWTTVQNSKIEGDYAFMGPQAIDGEQFLNNGKRRTLISMSGNSAVDDHEEPASTGVPPWQ